MNPTFVIYRIFGNSLPPRHAPDDTYNLIRYIIENEPPLPSCEKRWLLNRIVHSEIEEKCVELIKAAGQQNHIIPFDFEAYSNTFLDASGMSKPLNPFAQRRNPTRITGGIKGQLLVQEWIIRQKSQALINLNLARNIAIELGNTQADWVLPLDGSCYFTTHAWNAFTRGIARNPDALYGILPMSRLTDNAQIPNSPCLPKLEEDEPSIAFRHDAPDRYDERLRYGNRNKAELLARLGVPGKWMNKRPATWDTAKRLEPIAKKSFVVCGAVYRLASGASAGDGTHDLYLYRARNSGVRQFVRRIDTALVKANSAAKRGADFCVIQPGASISSDDPNNELLHLAEQMLERPVPLVTDKSEIPPSGDIQDYHSLVRDLHIIGGRATGGSPVDSSIIGLKESRRYDRGAFYECVQQASILTAAGALLGKRKFLQKSANILTAWFIDDDTKMNPNARFAQWNPEEPKEANSAGVIELRDLWTLPYLSKTLFAQGAISEEQLDAIKSWCTEFLDYLKKSVQGRSAHASLGEIGTWTHLLGVSLALFVGEFQVSTNLISNVSLRLVDQYDVNGILNSEDSRTRSPHRLFSNLTAWTLLANLCRSVGFDVWTYRGVEGQSICGMMYFVQKNMTSFQESDAEMSKYVMWFHSLLHLVPDTASDRSLLVGPRHGDNLAWTDDPNIELPSQWPHFLVRHDGKAARVPSHPVLQPGQP